MSYRLELPKSLSSILHKVALFLELVKKNKNGET